MEIFKDEHMRFNYREYNDMQTSLDDISITSLPKEVYNNILTTIDEVKLVNNLVSKSIRDVSDMPKDDDNKVIVDLTNPHRLTNMDYFRPSALYFKKHGKYTNATPSKHPKSPYRLFWREEKRRCLEGYIRDDGE